MISDETAARLEKGERAENKLDKIKRDGEAMADKFMEVLGSAGAGLGYGILNRRQGGNLDVPYQVGGKISLDAALAGAGVVLALTGKDKSSAVHGAASAWIGIYSARYGDAYEANKLIAAGTATTPLVASNQAGNANTAQAATPAAGTTPSTGAPMLHGRSYMPGLIQRGGVNFRTRAQPHYG
jgi:hypothetical protein